MQGKLIFQVGPGRLGCFWGISRASRGQGLGLAWGRDSQQGQTVSRFPCHWDPQHGPLPRVDELGDERALGREPTVSFS